MGRAVVGGGCHADGRCVGVSWRISVRGNRASVALDEPVCSCEIPISHAYLGESLPTNGIIAQARRTQERIPARLGARRDSRTSFED